MDKVQEFYDFLTKYQDDFMKRRQELNPDSNEFVVVSAAAAVLVDLEDKYREIFFGEKPSEEMPF